MIIEKKTKKTIECDEPVAIVCDVCKKEYKYRDDSDVFEVQEFVNIEFVGGYGSVFGDGDLVRLDMCQHCFKEKFGEYVRIISE